MLASLFAPTRPIGELRRHTPRPVRSRSRGALHGGRGERPHNQFRRREPRRGGSRHRGAKAGGRAQSLAARDQTRSPDGRRQDWLVPLLRLARQPGRRDGLRPALRVAGRAAPCGRTMDRAAPVLLPCWLRHPRTQARASRVSPRLARARRRSDGRQELPARWVWPDLFASRGEWPDRNPRGCDGDPRRNRGGVHSLLGVWNSRRRIAANPDRDSQTRRLACLCGGEREDGRPV